MASVTLVVILGAACSSPTASRSAARSAVKATPSSAMPTRVRPQASLARTRPAITHTSSDQPGWLPVATSALGVAVDIRSVSAADGAAVTVTRFFAGRTRFDLHVGSNDPPANGRVIGADAAPSVGATERPSLLAAFNGGFLSSSEAGGFEVNGIVIRPLRAGLATFAIDANGSGHIGVWQENLPAPGEYVRSARQNLPALVRFGRPSPDIAYMSAWGATLGHRAFVARSALGEDANGDVLFAASMGALPSDLAAALIGSGATTAMELDINPQWVQLALASHPGGPLIAGIAGQHRPPDQYLNGWTRDFIAVLARNAQP